MNFFGPDGLAARWTSSGWEFYTFDPQGSVSQRLNSSSTIKSASNYDAYGHETTVVPTGGATPTDPWAYNAQWGYYFERDIGLYYCHNRWYDPSNGRWLNRDPIHYDGGVNLYGYCGQSVVDRMDPAGEFTLVEIAVGAVTAVIIVLGAKKVIGEIKKAFERHQNAEEGREKALFPGDPGNLDVDGALNAQREKDLSWCGVGGKLGEQGINAAYGGNLGGIPMPGAGIPGAAAPRIPNDLILDPDMQEDVDLVDRLLKMIELGKKASELLPKNKGKRKEHTTQ